MAYSSTNPPRKVLDIGIGQGSLWVYQSTDPSTAVGGVTGYFAGVGAAGNSTGNLGMRVGDLVLVSESTGGATPGRSFIGMVKSSTANQASTSGSTGWAAAYDCTLSSATT